MKKWLERELIFEVLTLFSKKDITHSLNSKNNQKENLSREYNNLSWFFGFSTFYKRKIERGRGLRLKNGMRVD